MVGMRAEAVHESANKVAVVGGGPAGLIAALALAHAGVRPLLFAPALSATDRRTTALLDGSVQSLRDLGLWAALERHATPLKKLRLVDATDRLVRAPEVLFDCTELGLDAFGHNIENEILRGELLRAATANTGIEIIAAAVEQVAIDADAVHLRTPSGEWTVRLCVAADGRHSVCRRAAGIATDKREFPQVALTMNLRHSRPHNNVSTEFHTRTGPFTLVPLQGARSSLVWVLDKPGAEAASAEDDASLSARIERQAHSILGKMEIEGTRGAFPLAVETARRFADRRIALVGEAGHVLPPIGAQGLNLGIRDAAAIARVAAEAIHAGGDPGDERVLHAYDEKRRADVRSRAMAVELFNRSLLSDFLPVHAARGLGLEIASRFGVLRRMLMRQGLGPDGATAPRLPKGEEV